VSLAQNTTLREGCELSL